MLILIAALLALQEPFTPPKAGKFRGEIVDAKGELIMRARMAIPETRPEKPTWGFIFVCHGFQGSEGNSYLDGTVAALKRAGLDQQYLCIAGKSKGEGWAEDDDDRFLRLFEWVKANYPVDPKKVYLFGSSNGARFVNRFGSLHQDLVAGVVSYCGTYDLSKMPEPAEKKTEWYYVHGGKDRPQNSQKMADELRKRGYRAVFRQLEGYGHTDIWDGKGHPDKALVDAVCDDWAAWLHSLPHAADLKPLETAARWRLGEARELLAKRAKDAALPEAERAAAAGAYARALGLSLAGSWKDEAAPLAVLREFLEDPLLRSAALEGCRKGLPESFELRPKGDAAEWAAYLTSSLPAPK